MLDLSCHCSGVRIRIGKRPDFINQCNCSLCTRAEADWAYFDPAEVEVEGGTTGYCRDDKADPSAEIQQCPECGATTHFTLTESAVARFGRSAIGVNMRLAKETDLAGIELRFPDGNSWPGEGPFSYLREPRIIGEPSA
jgi:hypothetical protein